MYKEFFDIVVITDKQYLHTHTFVPPPPPTSTTKLCKQKHYKTVLHKCKCNQSAGHMFQHLLHCNINAALTTSDDDVLRVREVKHLHTLVHLEHGVVCAQPHFRLVPRHLLTRPVAFVHRRRFPQLPHLLLDMCATTSAPWWRSQELQIARKKFQLT